MQTEARLENSRSFNKSSVIGYLLVILCVIALIYPAPVAGAFTAAANKIKSVAFDAFLMNIVGWAIIASVIIGRLMERGGFTDALIKVFIPIMRRIGINPLVVVPGIYNIVGDINAAGKIVGPVFKKVQATKDEQRIAIATMVQSQQSFSTFMLGLVCLTAAKVYALPIVIVTMFLPLILVPFILKNTIYCNTRPVTIDELPSFTPKTPLIATLFGAAREGAEVLFLIVIPAAAAVFCIIGVLEYAGIWQVFEGWLAIGLNAMSIDVKTGVISVLASPTLAMGMLTKVAANIDPKMVVGSFVLAASGLPIGVVFGQIPMIWKGACDLDEMDVIKAASIGIIMRIITAWLVAELLTPLCIMK